jgi:hypothetical protein
MTTKTKINNCTLVLRKLKHGTSVAETNLNFHTLEELFAYCVSHKDAQLAERLSISGRDEEGRARLLTFTFQSVTSLPE